MIDGDLQGTWEFLPKGQDGWVEHAVNGYGDAPYLFRAFKQNGSRLHLRLLAPDGKDARYPETDEYLAGERIERRAYTSDVRRGVHWRRPA